jgi:hypothetical protein
MLKLKNIVSINNIFLVIKIIIIYISLLFTFYKIENKEKRLIFTSIIYLLCICLFNIDYKLSILYVFIAICCVITESIYITFFNETWVYINPDIINIPYWLIAMWSIAILLIAESVNKFKNIV